MAAWSTKLDLRINVFQCLGWTLSTENNRHGAVPCLYRESKRALLGSVCALGVAMVLASGSAASAAWGDYGGYNAGYNFRPMVKHSTHKAFGRKNVDRKDKKIADHSSKEPFGSVTSGPIQIVISINQQKVHLYSGGQHVTDALVATGVPGHPTPMGVFSVIEKDRYHHSNIYSGAPMPFMQRITWSGVAMHEGPGVGHVASHGCIRMPHDFVARLWLFTRLGARVIIARPEVKPVDIADSHLFVHKDAPPSSSAALEFVRTAQSIDSNTTTDAVATLPTRPALNLRTSVAPADPAPTGAISGGKLAAGTTATAVTPNRAGLDPTLIKEGQDVATGVAAGAEASALRIAPAAEPAKAEAPKTNEATATVQPAAPTVKPVEAIKPAAVVTAEISKPAAVAPVAKPSESAKPATTAEIKPAAIDGAIMAPPAIELEDVPLPLPKPAALARFEAARTAPIAVFVSRKEGKIYVRQNFAPLFDAPITIDHPEKPFGTHVFTAIEYADGGKSAFHWNVLSLPGSEARAVRSSERTYDKHGRVVRHRAEPAAEAEPQPLGSPADALARIGIAQDVIEHISEMMVPGSSLVVSDQGLGPETGSGTDFIVVTR